MGVFGEERQDGSGDLLLLRAGASVHEPHVWQVRYAPVCLAVPCASGPDAVQALPLVDPWGVLIA